MKLLFRGFVFGTALLKRTSPTEQVDFQQLAAGWQLKSFCPQARSLCVSGTSDQ